MPALGMAQETGTIIRWLKQPGDRVESGEPLMEIETDKATVEIEAPASGSLARVTAQEGDEVPVGTAVAVIVADGEAPPAEPGPQAEAVQPAAPPAPPVTSPIAARIAAEHDVDLSKIRRDGGRITKQDVVAYLNAQSRPAEARLPAASPKARRMAAERGLELDILTGSGPAGAVLTQDVLAAAGTMAPAQARVDLTATWRTMARRVTESWSTVPHFTLTRRIRADALLDWLERGRRQSGAKITVTDLLASQTAQTLRAHPRVNVSWIQGELVRQPEVHLALAVATDHGLVAPVLHRAADLELSELASLRAELVAKARNGQLDPADLQGGTFTLTNLGMFGVDAFQAIINPPQAAILAVGRIAEQVVAVDGEARVANVMTLSLSCDHRAVDGAMAAQFLDALAAGLEDPPIATSSQP
jgi:pyruvate dehydrogenase E2 component (dihydrolipoamide acetyltransferase)